MDGQMGLGGRVVGLQVSIVERPVVHIRRPQPQRGATIEDGVAAKHLHGMKGGGARSAILTNLNRRWSGITPLEEDTSGAPIVVITCNRFSTL